MLVASGTLISPETQSLRVFPKPLGLATKYAESWGPHISAGACSPCSVLATPPQLSQTSTRRRRGGTQCWAAKSFPGPAGPTLPWV